MPYIPQVRRPVAKRTPHTVGELTYALTQLAVSYSTFSRTDSSFAIHAEVIAALECAKMEYYRRVVAPYEDMKCLENGEVY